MANQAGDLPSDGDPHDVTPGQGRTESLVNSLRHEDRSRRPHPAPDWTSRSAAWYRLMSARPEAVGTVPIFIGGVVLMSFLLLMTVFRSILFALKAAVMNLLSISAALGVVALATRGGPGRDLVGIPKTTPVPILMPMMLFAILFGLSMDYEVFLLRRIPEEYHRTDDNAGRRPRSGQDRTGHHRRRRDHGAVFAVLRSPATSSSEDDRIGLAAAVFIDATIVRMVLVPATMELLGDLNWWLPRWLDRLLPVVHLDTPPITEEPEALRDAADGQDATVVARTAARV